MANLLYVFRYFRAVPPIPALMLSAFAVITLIGALAIVLLHTRDGAVAVPVLVLQAFSASTGFSAPARRGYFDLLLTRGEARTRIAVVQWLTATAPGVASGAVLAVVYAAAHRDLRNPLLSSGTLLALLLVSTVPWAVTVALPRFSGAIGWLLVVTLGASGGVSWPEPVREVVFPLDLIGAQIGGRRDVLLASVLLSSLSVAAALWWVHRSDIRLEAAQ